MSTLALIGAFGTGVSMVIVSVIGISDPMLATRWKSRAAWVGLGITYAFAIALLVGVIGLS